MRMFVISCAFVTCSAVTALAGETAISSTTLDSMGLGQMQQMSDEDGLAVRGKGPFDMLLSGIFPSFTTGGLPGTQPDPTPGSPFDSPFGGDSLIGDFQGGSTQFGTGPSVGGNSFGFGPNFPWPLQ